MTIEAKLNKIFEAEQAKAVYQHNKNCFARVEDEADKAVSFAAQATGTTREQVLDKWREGDAFTLALIEAAAKRIAGKPLHA